MGVDRIRWRGAVAASAVFAAVGLSARVGTLVLAAVIPLAYVVYGSLGDAEATPRLVAERRVDPATAVPGRPVSVDLLVRNCSDRTLSDVRVVDGVPIDLEVIRGSPREGTVLRPGDAVRVRYDVVAKRGEHDFEGPSVRIRTKGGGSVATVEPRVLGDQRLVCRLDADAPPLEEAGSESVGQLTTDSPGRGLEFHSTREYRHGDDAGRIDWRHYAKQGQLATVNYEERRSTTVVVALDAREAARVVAGPGRPTAVELSAYAATSAVTELLGAGHDVAVALLGCEAAEREGLLWLPPGSGSDHRSRALDVLRYAVEVEAPDGDAEAHVTELLERAPPGAQVALFSPVLDDLPVEAVETWTSYDHPVAVLSPDVVTENTVSGQYESVRRRTRLARCLAAGARTIDWRRGTPLPIVLEYAFASDARLGGRIGASAGGGR